MKGPHQWVSGSGSIRGTSGNTHSVTSWKTRILYYTAMRTSNLQRKIHIPNWNATPDTPLRFSTMIFSKHRLRNYERPFITKKTRKQITNAKFSIYTSHFAVQIYYIYIYIHTHTHTHSRVSIYDGVTFSNVWL